MASTRRLFRHSFRFLRNYLNENREFSTLRQTHKSKWLQRTCGCAAAGLVLYTIMKTNSLNTVYAFKKGAKKEDEPVSREVKLTSRERRFLKFASVVYDGQTYMTPQDFVESFIHQEPNPPRVRRELSKSELDKIRHATPHLNKGSPQMFRQLKDNGIISYTEYLFLLSILTKPLSGFRIAFNMFDTDGNERVDKSEFLVLQHLFARRRNIDPEEKKVVSVFLKEQTKTN